MVFCYIATGYGFPTREIVVLLGIQHAAVSHAGLFRYISAYYFAYFSSFPPALLDTCRTAEYFKEKYSRNKSPDMCPEGDATACRPFEKAAKHLKQKPVPNHEKSRDNNAGKEKTEKDKHVNRRSGEKYCIGAHYTADGAGSPDHRY
jgi:hypothetical protein